MIVISESGEIGEVQYTEHPNNYRWLSEADRLTDDYISDNITNRSSILKRDDIKKYPDLIKMIRSLLKLKRLIKDINYEKC